MFKVYGVTDESESSSKMEIRPIESSSSEPIEVELQEERDFDTDTGQIAVDVLDLPDSVVIVAPIA